MSKLTRKGLRLGFAGLLQEYVPRSRLALGLGSDGVRAPAEAKLVTAVLARRACQSGSDRFDTRGRFNAAKTRVNAEKRVKTGKGESTPEKRTC